jgi:5-methyltetrahydrofolate--homocysteine methyltransferase
MPNSSELQAIREAIVGLSIEKTEEATKNAMAAGINTQDILVDGLAAGLVEVGDKWLRKEMFISHVLVAAQAMKAGQTHLRVESKGRDFSAIAVLGTAKGDLHDIGKNLVATMLSAGGFEVYDLGVDVEPQTFVEKAKEVDADLIGISLIMSICLPAVQDTCDLVKEQGCRAKVLIGGPATSKVVADKVGANGYGGFDAPTGVQRARQMVGIN